MPDNKSKRRIRYINPPTVQGCWSNMCMECFHTYGVGLGTGKGQEYQKEGIDWYKTRG